MSDNSLKQATIYVVATPIGNLEDISQRALRILGEVDLILSEDTRVTRKLLSSFNISGKKLISYQDYNEANKKDSILSKIKDESLCVALVSDAGTPCISDPGYRLIDTARTLGINVIPIPGPCAAVSLISVSGLPSDRFTFVGFLPLKQSARQNEFKLWSTGGSFLFYETAKRIIKTLTEIGSIFPECTVCVGKELTKYFETTLRSSIREVLSTLDKMDQSSTLKGEFCVMVYVPPRTQTFNQEDIIEECRKRLNKESIKDILESFSECSIPRKTLYKLLLDIKNNKI